MVQIGGVRVLVLDRCVRMMMGVWLARWGVRVVRVLVVFVVNVGVLVRERFMAVGVAVFARSDATTPASIRLPPRACQPVGRSLSTTSEASAPRKGAVENSAASRAAPSSRSP
jgi:hypothetical protein